MQADSLDAAVTVDHDKIILSPLHLIDSYVVDWFANWFKLVEIKMVRTSSEVVLG